MRYNLKYLLLQISLVLFFFGCKSYDSCLLFNKVYKIKDKDIPFENNGFYFLCYLEEEPVVSLDSLLKYKLPKHLIEKDLILIKLKVKPVDIYFTKYSREDALKMWLAVYNGDVEQNKSHAETLLKKDFLNFNSICYITCNPLDVNFLIKAYHKKTLLLLDKKASEFYLDYSYCLNAKLSKRIDFSKLFSFDEVYKDFMNENQKINGK